MPTRRDLAENSDNLLGRAFGQILAEARKAAGITQEELADKSGFHRTYVAMLERGQRRPSLRSMIDLAGALDSTATVLVRRTEARLHSLLRKTQGTLRRTSVPDSKRAIAPREASRHTRSVQRQTNKVT